jgi:hypothetical protein
VVAEVGPAEANPGVGSRWLERELNFVPRVEAEADTRDLAAKRAL